MSKRSSWFILLFAILLCHRELFAQISDDIYTILHNKYECVYNGSMDIPLPKFIQYKYNAISFIMNDKSKYVMKTLSEKPKKTTSERTLPIMTSQYTDSRGITYEMMSGKIRSSTSKMITTRDTYATFAMYPDKERAAVYFLSRPADGTPGEGSVFAMDTSKATGELNTHELSFLGEAVAALGVEPGSGGIAVASKSDTSGWQLIVLRKTDRRPTTTPPPTTTATTEAPVVEFQGRLVAEDEVDFGALVEESVNAIKDLFADEASECLALQRRTDAWVKNYAKTLELTAEEEALERRNSLPPKLPATINYANALEVEVEAAFQSIAAAYERAKRRS